MEYAPALELGIEDCGRYSVGVASGQGSVVIEGAGGSEECAESHYPVMANYARFDRPPVFHARDNRDDDILREIDLGDRFVQLVEDLLGLQGDRLKMGSKTLKLSGSESGSNTQTCLDGGSECAISPACHCWSPCPAGDG